MTTIGTKIFTWMRGRFVGEDESGNRYYEERGHDPRRRRRRWAIYKGLAEASKVPGHWHGWLHYTHDAPPPAGGPAKLYPWQKEHLPNLTGTPRAYLPQGHILRGGKRAATASDYEPWKP